MIRAQDRKGVTLVELMVAILILAILVSLAIPIIRANTDRAKWSEGKAIMGTIAHALRAYLALEAENFDNNPTAVDLGIVPGDFDGTYFREEDFSWVINSYVPVDFVVTATAPPGIASPSQVTLTAAGVWTEMP